MEDFEFLEEAVSVSTQRKSVVPKVDSKGLEIKSSSWSVSANPPFS
ncbi:MAG: hypothetical protein R2769_16365 [Saprospiraceae bacterium]